MIKIIGRPKVWSEKKCTNLKICFLLKNPQFLPDHYETSSEKGAPVYHIWTKFCYKWVKNCGFFSKSISLGLCTFFRTRP